MRTLRVSFVIGLLLLAAPAATRADSALKGIDVMTSTVMQEGQSSFSGVGLRARLHPAAIVPELEFMPTIEYWRNSSHVDPYDIRAQRKDATLGIDARYAFELGSWHPYFGGGFALHFLSSTVDAPAFGLNDASDSLMKGGFAALGGLIFNLNEKVDTLVELKYHEIPDYRQLKFNWGLAFNF
jgi:opacity protein-like surface antigen